MALIGDTRLALLAGMNADKIIVIIINITGIIMKRGYVHNSSGMLIAFFNRLLTINITVPIPI